MYFLNRFLSCVAGLAALLLLVASGPASAAEDMYVELNKVESTNNACRAFLIFDNPSDITYPTYTLDVYVLDNKAVIARRLLVEAGPLRSNKTTIKIFDVPGANCASIGQFVLNSVIGCETLRGKIDGCTEAITLSSRASIDLAQ